MPGSTRPEDALGYIFQHLATHHDDHEWIAANPASIPAAVEEFLRLYGLLIQDGRYVEHDIDFHGCPMKQGDVVWLGLASASRDPAEFDRAGEFVRDRRSNRHLAFGAGPHHCLGAHLARKELVIVLEEWFRRIPNFRIAPGASLRERGGQLTLLSLPLEWDC